MAIIACLSNWNIALYLLTLPFITTALVTVYRTSSNIGMPAGVMTCICGGSILYLASLIPGAFRMLYPLPVALTAISLSVITTMLFARYPSAERAAYRQGNAAINGKHVLWCPIAIVLSAALIVYLYPFWSDMIRLVSVIAEPYASLSWDTVSYHLPNFVDFRQNHSLYPFTNSLIGVSCLQTYCFGFELIGNYPAVFMPLHWGVMVAHVFSVAMLFLSVWLINKQILKLLNSDSVANQMVSFLATIAIWYFFFNNELNWLGKNDFFQAASILSALGLILYALNLPSLSKHAYKFFLLLATCTLALVLALAAKQTSIVFLVMLPLFVGLYFLFTAEGRVGLLRLCLSICLPLAFIIIFGGFSLIRNYFLVGGIADFSTVAAACKYSLWANKFSSVLYSSIDNVLLLEVICTAPFLLLLLFALCLQHSCTARQIVEYLKRPLLLLTSKGAEIPRPPAIASKLSGLIAMATFLVVGLATFAITPYGLWSHDEAGHNFQIQARLGMAICTVSFSVLAIAVSVAVLRFSSWLPIRKPRIRLPANLGRRYILAGYLSAIAITLLVAVSIICLWQLHPPRGLPGYERIHSMVPSRVYRWVQHCKEPLRIYSAGLRPYGLYGNDWQNRVFYDLHSSQLNTNESGKARFAAILFGIKPQLVLIMKDPNASKAGDSTKQFINWLDSQTNCFQRVFSDEAVTGYQVQKPAYEVISHYTNSGVGAAMSG